MPTFLKNLCQQLNFVLQCRRYSLGLWQCPSFLFVVMGIIIILVILVTYFIASVYSPDPQVPALIVLIVASILITIGHLIVRSFDNLAEVSRMKSEFVNIVSHQLRTPLSSLKWSLGLLMSGRIGYPNQKHLEQLEMIKHNTERMIKLVSDLLDVSKIEQGKFILNPQNIALEKIAQDLIEEYSPLAKASNVTLNLITDKKLPLVFADPQKIRLVFQNLLDNAVRYIKGGGRVNIKLKKKGDYLRCEVEDNGVGIPERDKKRIFEKFFRSANVMKYQTIGTGLGLFIAKAIIEASKGKIGFQSQEGKGTTFWFELPIK